MTMTLRDTARRLVRSERTPRPVTDAALAVRDGVRRSTARWRVLPDFVIIGTHKGGTTSLYDYLAGHPHVVPAFEKEVHYFDRRYDGQPESYQMSFPNTMRMNYVQRRHGAAITGEASPYYLSHPHIPSRAAAMLPDAKFIALLRNPVERAISAFHHNRRRTPNEPLESFEQAVERELTLLANEYDKLLTDEQYPDSEYAWHCYLARSVYARHLERWYESVPRDRVLVLQSERLGSSPDAVFDEVLEFLDLPSWRPPHFERLNANSYPDVDPGLRAELVEWFRPHNERLFELLGTRYDWG
jgi:hypothetical protein